MKLHHPLFQLSSLIGGKVEIADIVSAVVVMVVVPKLGLDSIGAQEGVSDEWTWQSSWQYVIPQLQTQVVSSRWDKTGREEGVVSQTSLSEGKHQQVLA